MKIGLIPQVVIDAANPASSVPYAPLGLLCLAGMVDRARHQVEIIDLTLAVQQGVLPYDRVFDKAAARLIHARSFDLVGFSTFSSTYHHTLNIVRELEALSPRTVRVFGGPQASFGHVETVEAFPVDYVVRGEGEQTFVELLDALESGRPPDDVRGLTFKGDSGVVQTEDRPLIPDLDSLPVPAFDLYPLKKHPKAPIEVARGCPYRCTFCATSRYWRRCVRHKSIDRIFSEMTLLGDTYDVDFISFADDTFTVNRTWATAFCEHLVSRRFRRKWICSTRIDAVDPALLRSMARAGCAHVFYGIESGSARVQKQIRKDIKVDRVLDNLKATAAAGIGVTASLMMGFPDETEEDLGRTLELRNAIQRLFPTKQAIQIHILSPDVDTEITLENADRLRYDGFHSDQSGVLNASFDEEMISKHPKLFLGYHYIETRYLDREFIKLLHCFLSAAQVICYWSSLYVMLRDGDPLCLARAWMARFHGDPRPEGQPPDAPLQRLATAHAAIFFQSYFRRENRIPAPVCDLYRHEFELMRVKGGLLVDRGLRRRATGPAALSTLRFDFDPRETIALIREDIRKIANQKPKPTKIDYSPRQRPDPGRS